MPSTREAEYDSDGRLITFEGELTRLLNRFGWDQTTMTPDFLLSSMVLGMLNSYNMCRSRRDKWWDFKPEIKYKKEPDSV